MQRRDKTDDAFRYLAGYRDQVRIRKRRQVSETVEAAIKALQQAAVAHLIAAPGRRPLPLLADADPELPDQQQRRGQIHPTSCFSG